ncbi:hypothetical protein ASPCAL08811 [Aspergillus calidoustus]|uniref:Integrase catalytic domain-containing protein n=1 Tax=Aspergillus calidoustus TaxID=454130 RepID=A0A0U5CQX3_ASPCI|nr:hypothetical protein ASPCAL08811 [Aspergillus calidoustus]
MAFHAKEKSGLPTLDYAKPPTPDQVEPIIFLSRSLSKAEKNYWPTEMEVAGIVWALRKLRHMVEASPETVIYTDHSATVNIAQSTSLSTSNVDRLNLRLVRASQYFHQFRNLRFFHKPGKTHIVPDALSRLPSWARDDVEDSIDMLYSWFGDEDHRPNEGEPHVMTIKLAADFEQRIRDGYQKEGRWTSIIKILKDNEGSPSPVRLPFRVQDNLIYTVPEGKLCIPDAIHQEVLKIAHDASGHGGVERTLHHLNGVTFSRARHKVKVYIDHCNECQNKRTRRHAPYGSLQPVIAPNISFHTITIDLILGLPDTGEYNAIMSVTCKSTKRLTAIPGRLNWTSAQWAEALLVRLQLGDWGIPVHIICDRDPKWLAGIWVAIFNLLAVMHLYTTAWHSQGGGQLEVSNQIIEIYL